MRGWLVFGAIVFAIAGCIHEQQAKNYNLPIVQSAYRPIQYPPWRLYTTCPVNRTNVPIRKEYQA